jgi:hypothetical protein
MRRPLTFAVLAAALLVTSGGAASAAAPPTVDIGVSPSKLQMRLVPGQTSHAQLDVYNKGTKPVTLDAFFQDYTITRQSSVVFKDPGSLPESAAPWSELNRTVLHIPAQTRKPVQLTIDVPSDAAIGTHTLAVVFRSREVKKSSGNVLYRPAVASLLAAGVENPDGTGLVMKGQVTSTVDVRWISLSSVVHSSDKLGALADWFVHPTVVTHTDVTNQGNTFFNILKGGTGFTTSFAVGGSHGYVKAPSYTILPNSTRTVDATWTGARWIGSGNATVRLYYNDTSALQAGPHRYVIVPWHLILTIAVMLLMIVGWRVVRRRRRRPKREPVPSPWITTGI